jgi:excisionase family DNA binding protein
VITPPELLVVSVPADVAVILLARAGLADYRRTHRGQNWRVDRVLIEMTEAAIRWQELATYGQHRAPDADTVPPLQRLTTRQVADLTGLSARTIRRAISDGRIAAERVGYAYLIDRDDVNQYRAAREA